MKLKKSLLFISIVGLFLAFLFIFIPNESLVEAATTDPATNLTTTSPPKSDPVTTNPSATKQPEATTTPIANTTTPTPSAPTLYTELEVTGLGGNDAVVTDMNGHPITPGEGLFTWLNFHVDYKWSIKDGVAIKAGDQVNFELPNGLVSSGDLSFPIYDSNGAEIGTASIKNGESSGTITFNNVLENTDKDRNGTLSFISKGTNNGDGSQGTNWMFNKGGWVSGYGPTGVPDQVTWNVAFNPNQHNLKNVVITDILGPNQEYVPGSLTAIAGSYGPGGFISNGQTLSPTVTVDGNKVIISFPGIVTTAVDIYYRVKLTDTSPNGTTTWYNHATMGSSEGDYSSDASTSWGGSGTGNGNQSVGSLTINKTDASTGATLAGAEYELTDSKGNVIISNGTTDENGALVINNLPYGSYTIKEVRAPDGYVLNSTPIEITIPDNGVINLTSDQKDNAIPGGVLLKKIDPDTKNSIAGATFDLLDKAGNVIKAGLVTDGNGEISVTDLAPGEYQFVETVPAAGYEPNSTPILFTVTSGQTTPVNLEKFNVATTVIPDTGSVVLTKVDATANKLLPGAIYDLLDSTGKVIQSNLTTDDKGQIVVSNLEAGDYSFVEVTAPTGYELDKTPIKFTVVKDLTNTLEAKDTATPTEPSKPEPPTTGPTEPGKPEPPTTGPTEPGKPEPPTTGPTEPGKPEPPVTGPTEPSKPGVTNPPTKPDITNPVLPSEPGVTNPPTENDEMPTLPGTILPPVGNNNIPSLTNNHGGSSVSSNNNNSSSSSNKGKFPQTGNQNGLLLTISGLLILMVLIMKHLIKRI